MAEEPGLFGDEESAPSAFSAALEEAGEKRGIGRPRGARNRKSVDFEKLYFARGFKDPLLVLGEIITADPRSLQALAADQAAELGLVKRVGKGESAIEVVELPGLVEILELQRKAAMDLAPYLHGKKPTEVVVTDERLPTLIVVTDSNQLEEAQQLLERRRQVALSAGSPLIEGEAAEKPGIAGVSEGGE